MEVRIDTSGICLEIEATQQRNGRHMSKIFVLVLFFCELGLRMLALRILLDFQVETILLDDSINFKERQKNRLYKCIFIDM